MADFLFLQHGDPPPKRQQTDKNGRLHIPKIAARFILDPQSIELEDTGFSWNGDRNSADYGLTDSNMLEQFPSKGRSKEDPLIVNGTASTGTFQLHGLAAVCVVLIYGVSVHKPAQSAQPIPSKLV